jgi:hypothetical protein
MTFNDPPSNVTGALPTSFSHEIEIVFVLELVIVVAP